MQDNQGPAIQVRHAAGTLSSLLGDIRILLAQLGEEFASEQKRILELEDRLASARFHLAVLGQFKRGKSTLLNALIGEELLPSAVVPVTSIPTFLSWGPRCLVRVFFIDGRPPESSSDSSQDASVFLACYVTESNNPKNRLGVSRVEVEHPSSLLQRGVVLIDTPGIGSTFQHNTEATLNFLPQCDAALFLVSADPPITQVEIEFLKAVRDKVVRTIFLMNKVDYLSEKERQQAVEFFKAVLRDQIGLDGKEPVFSVSARLGLECKLNRNESSGMEDGMPEVENYLMKFLSEEKMQTLRLAIARKATDVLDDSLLHLRLKRRSLTLRLEDLEQRLAILKQKLTEIDRQRMQAKDVLDGDRKRTLEILEKRSAEMSRAALIGLSPIVDELVSSTREVKAIEPTVRARLAEAIPEFFEAALTETSQYMNERVQGVLNTHQEMTNALTNAVRQTAAELFEMPYIPSRHVEDLDMKEKPCWVAESWTTAMTPIPRGTFELILPRNMAVRRIRKWLQEDLEGIISRNIEKLRWPTLQKIEDTFRRFALNLDQQLTEVAQSTLAGIQQAHTQRMQKSGSVNAELSRLASFESEIMELQSKLMAGSRPSEGDK
jgi:GTPase SAR1 family protein